MKLLVIGLDGAAPEILFGDDRLANFRRLMDLGCYGQLESAVDSNSLQAAAIWEHLARAGKRSLIIDLSPSNPPRATNGSTIAEVDGAITRVMGDYLTDVASVREDDGDGLKDQAYSTSRKQFDHVRRFLQSEDWDYFQFVEIGLDHIQRGFWQYHDSRHALFEPGNPYGNVVGDYYLYLDEQIGTILEALTDETVVLVVSLRGWQGPDVENDAREVEGVDHSGSFILAAPHLPLHGEVHDADLSDIAPTLLDLGGYDIPASMQGRPLASGLIHDLPGETGLSRVDEAILRERLSGLGYI